MKSKEKIYYISPDWRAVAVFAICGLMFLHFILFNVESRLAVFSHFHKPALLLSCAFAILSTTSYSFYTDRIEVKVLFFTIRCVYWENVTGAMYFCPWSKTGPARRQSYLIICIWPCQAEDPGNIEFAKLDRKHGKKLIRIPGSEKLEGVFKVLEQKNIEVYGLNKEI